MPKVMPARIFSPSFYPAFILNRERGTTLKSLVCNLGSVWRKFLETVSSSGMDFLSLEHLGIVLKCLAAKGELVKVLMFLDRECFDVSLLVLFKIVWRWFCCCCFLTTTDHMLSKFFWVFFRWKAVQEIIASQLQTKGSKLDPLCQKWVWII